MVADMGNKLPECSSLSPERLAYWYFRLNGFLLLENFRLHPDRGSNAVSDVDLLAVRFLHRKELFLNPMEDDPNIYDKSAYVTAHLVEVKTSLGRLNLSWLRSDAIERALKALGVCPEDMVPHLAKQLRTEGNAQAENAFIQVTVVADRPSKDLKARFISFDEIVTFIYRRFSDFKLQKADVSSWPNDGRCLRSLAASCRDEQAYRSAVRQAFGLQP